MFYFKSCLWDVYKDVLLYVRFYQADEVIFIDAPVYELNLVFPRLNIQMQYLTLRSHEHLVGEEQRGGEWRGIWRVHLTSLLKQYYATD